MSKELSVEELIESALYCFGEAEKICKELDGNAYWEMGMRQMVRALERRKKE